MEDYLEQQKMEKLEWEEKAKSEREKMEDLRKQVIEAGKQNNFEKAFLDCL